MSREDAQDWDEWRIGDGELRGKLAKMGLPRKLLLKWCMRVHCCQRIPFPDLCSELTPTGILEIRGEFVFVMTVVV